VPSPQSEIEAQIRSIAETVKGTIATLDLAGAGKLQPAKMPPRSKKKSEDEADLGDEEVAKGDAPEGFKSPALYAQIIKAEKRIVTGLVLQPEVVDGQGDIMSAEVISDAAYRWLANFNKSTKLGLQHKSFKKKEDRFVLVESYIAPINFVMGTTPVKAGSWVLSVKVVDDKLWEACKAGEITGFSIGGKATAINLEEES
jgi:hypothetical protein